MKFVAQVSSSTRRVVHPYHTEGGGGRIKYGKNKRKKKVIPDTQKVAKNTSLVKTKYIIKKTSKKKQVAATNGRQPWDKRRGVTNAK